MRILIVDDKQTNRNLLRALIEEFEDRKESIAFEILEAKNGLEAVSLAAEKTFDIVFMDIIMPEMDGIEATKKIYAAAPETFIIAVSAAESDESKTKILNSGASDYLSKPVDSNIFYNHLEHYTGEVLAR